MAIPISRLSQLLAGCGCSTAMLVSLRENGLVLQTATDDQLLAVIRRAESQTAREMADSRFTWASTDARIPGLLAAYGYLTEKGLSWLPRPLSADELARLRRYVSRESER
jgi:hypothetical protein